MQIRPSQIPPEVVRVTESLEKAGFEAWIVGGCVRDLLLGRTPKDWDVTTNATPEEVQAAFPHTYYTNEFGTVGVVNDPPAGGQAIDESLKVIEVTPYRLEGKYSDARRPDSVQFSRHIEDDLKRRDFTINALAYSPTKGHLPAGKAGLLDLYGGIKDMDARLVRAVGGPEGGFEEGALRGMCGGGGGGEGGFGGGCLGVYARGAPLRGAGFSPGAAAPRRHARLGRTVGQD